MSGDCGPSCDVALIGLVWHLEDLGFRSRERIIRATAVLAAPFDPVLPIM